MCYQTHIRVHRAQPKDLFTLKYFFKFKQLFFFVYNEFLRVSRLNHKFFLERKRFEFDKKNGDADSSINRCIWGTWK